MAYSAASGEGEDCGEDSGVALDEGDGGGEFGGGGECGGGVEGRGGEEGGEKKVGGCEEGGEDVLRDHHLWAGVGAVSAEDVVLGAVCEAVEEEIDC